MEMFVAASNDWSLNTLKEVDEPAEMGVALGTDALRCRSILTPGAENVQESGCFDQYRPTFFDC